MRFNQIGVIEELGDGLKTSLHKLNLDVFSKAVSIYTTPNSATGDI